MVIDKNKTKAAHAVQENTGQPHPIDRLVGNQIRMRRRDLGMSQERLAEHLGLTFQQVQKYERGHNRVSASKLFQIAEALETDISYFFKGAETPGTHFQTPQDQAIFSEFLGSSDGVDLVQVWPRVPPRSRRKIMGLLKVLAGDEEEAEALA